MHGVEVQVRLAYFAEVMATYTEAEGGSIDWEHNQMIPEIVQPLLCTTFTLTYFFHLTSFYWMFLEGFYLFLQVQYTP